MVAVLFTWLSCTTEKCWCVIWCFIQADATSLKNGEGRVGTPPISTIWGKCAPKYLMQRCPLDCATSLCSNAALMYVVHLGSETEMRTIPPFNWQFMYSVRTLIWSKSPCFLPELPRAGNAQHFRTSPALDLSSCALTSLESLVFEAEDCLFGFSYCSPCWLAEGHSESKGTVRKKCWGERRWGKCSRWAKVPVHVSIKRILCLLVYFCMQHATEKEEGFFVFVFP